MYAFILGLALGWLARGAVERVSLPAAQVGSAPQS